MASNASSSSSSVENDHPEGLPGHSLQADADMNEMMVIEVNFGKEKNDSIVVHFNDDANDLAAEFVKRHGLKSSAIPRVAKYIDDTIQDFKNTSSQLRPQSPSLDGTEKGTSQDDCGNMQPPVELPPPEISDSAIADTIKDNGFKKNSEHNIVNDGSSGDREDTRSEEGSCSELGGISSCSDNSNVNSTQKSIVDESAEEKYNRIKETCSIASSNNSSPDRKNKKGNLEQPIPLLEKMRRVDFFQSNISSNKNDMVRRGSNKDKKNTLSATNERLYKDAFHSKQRKNRILAKARADEEKELSDMKWAMNEGSKKIMKNITSKGDVGSRLYQEGLMDKERRDEFSRKEQAICMKGVEAHQLEENQHVNTWSCASCGTFHELKSVKLKSYLQRTDVEKVCSKCNWDQSKRAPFKPIIMTTELPVKGAIAATQIDEKREAHIDAVTSSVGKPAFLGIGLSTFQSTSVDDETGRDDNVSGIFTTVEQIKNGDKKASRIHEYLHANKQMHDIKRVQLVCKHLDEENKIYTFKPSIPSTSHNIVNKFKECKLSPPQTQVSSTSRPSSSSSSKDEANIISRFTDEVNWQASLTSGRTGDRKVVQKSPPKRRQRVDDDTQSSSRKNVPLQKYLKQPTHTRLYNHSKSLVSLNQSVPTSKPSPAQNKENEKKSTALAKTDFQQRKQKQKEYTDKLVYEYKEKNKRMSELIEQLKPSFQPEIYGFSTEVARQYNDHDHFISDLLKRGEEHEKSKEALKQMLDTREKEKIEAAKQQYSKSLQHSNYILEQSNSRIIDEMYRLLVEAQKDRDNSFGDCDEIRSLANENDQLDLSKLEIQVMIPEVRDLLTIVREDYVKSLNLEDKEQQLYIGFEQFKNLVFDGMKKKGIGKSYIYVPKKKPEVNVQSILEAERNLTFKPDLSSIPAHLTDSRMKVDKDVLSAHLHSKYKEAQERKEKLREKLMQDEMKDCTFQPKLYKRPDSVKVSYRHHGQHSKNKTTSNEDIKKSPRFVPTTSTSSSLPLTQSSLASPATTVDNTQTRETPTLENEYILDSETTSFPPTSTLVTDPSFDETHEALYDSVPPPPPPPLPVEAAENNEQQPQEDIVVENESRLSRTSSDVSSLEEAGIRKLGEYDEDYHRQRDEDELEESPTELQEPITLERTSSVDTSDMLRAMISEEIEQSSMSSGMPDQNVPLSGEGSAEIDSNPIPFETYANATEYSTVDNDDASSVAKEGQKYVNPFDLIDAENAQMDEIFDGETNEDHVKTVEPVVDSNNEQVVAEAATGSEQEHHHCKNKHHHGGVKHGKGKHSRIHRASDGNVDHDGPNYD